VDNPTELASARQTAAGTCKFLAERKNTYSQRILISGIFSSFLSLDSLCRSLDFPRGDFRRFFLAPARSILQFNNCYFNSVFNNNLIRTRDSERTKSLALGKKINKNVVVNLL
jgi:hypothetical protein